VSKKRIITALQLDEISGVDKAAQVPAEALLRKRAPKGSYKPGKKPKGKMPPMDGMPPDDEEDDTLEKHYEYTRPMLTTNVVGHQHVLDDVGAGGETSYVRSEGEEYGHSHSWVRMLDGSVAIGAADGHSHEVIDPTNKSASGGANKETDMTQPTQKAAEGTQIPEAVQKSINDLTSANARLEAILKLNADERGLFDGLNADGQTSFLAKSASDRAELIRASKDSNRVVYKAANGDEYRASDDPRLVKMAKERDEEKQRTEKALAEVAMERLTKRAEAEMSHCPGTPEVRAGILKALEGVPGAAEFVKAADASLSKAFTPSGTKGNGSDVMKAEDRLEVLAKAYATEHKCSIEKARDLVLDTPEGAKLYAEMDTSAVPVA
jgi:hypothetical protein